MHEIGIEWIDSDGSQRPFSGTRGIPDEKSWNGTNSARIAGANYYNIQDIPGQLTVEPDSGKNIFKNSVCHRRRYQRDDDNGCTGAVSGRRNGENLSMGGISESDRKGHRKSMAAAGGRKIGYSVKDKFLMACEMEEKLMAVLDTYTIPYMADSECMGVCCEWHRESQSQMYHIAIRSAEMMMTISTVLSTPISEEQIPDTLETCMALNQEAWGSFYLDDGTGCVGYHLTAVYGRHVDRHWIAARIALAEAAIGDWKKKEDDWRAQAR